MVDEIPKMQAIFPDYPRGSPVINKESNFSSLWDLGFSSLFQALQNNFKSEGILFPKLYESQMATIAAKYAPYIGGSYDDLTLALPDISGQTVFDRDTYISNQFVIAQDNTGTVLLAEWVPFAMMLTNPGNPNGSVAGVLNWLCYDITNKVLYACTTAGNAATAVWTSI